MKTMQHSPVSHIDLDELLWLQGYGIFEPTHGSEIGNSFHFDVLPFEPDPQHSCQHGTQRHETALVGFGWAVVVCVNILLWCAIYAVAEAVWRAVW